MEMTFRMANLLMETYPWDVSSVNNMKLTFEDANFEGDLSAWNVSNVSDMSDVLRN